MGPTSTHADSQMETGWVTERWLLPPLWTLQYQALPLHLLKLALGLETYIHRHPGIQSYFSRESCSSATAGDLYIFSLLYYRSQSMLLCLKLPLLTFSFKTPYQRLNCHVEWSSQILTLATTFLSLSVNRSLSPQLPSHPPRRWRRTSCLHGGDRDSHRGAHGPDWEVVLGSHRFCWLELSHSYLQCPSYYLTSCSGPHYLELSTLLHLTHSYSVRFLSQVLILPLRSFLLVPNLSGCPTHMTMITWIGFRAFLTMLAAPHPSLLMDHDHLKAWTVPLFFGFFGGGIFQRFLIEIIT